MGWWSRVQLAMDDGIFFRLLSQLSATQLQRHCNTVFRNELRLVRAELKELLAAQERLQEVRKAVALAENGRAGVGRTPSLLATMKDTLRTRDSVMQLVGMLGARMGLPDPGSSSAAAVEPEPPLQEPRMRATGPEESTRKRTRNAPEHDVEQEEDKTEEHKRLKRRSATEAVKANRRPVASEFEKLLDTANDLNATATAKDSRRVANLVTKVTNQLSASFPTKRAQQRSPPDDDTIDAAARAVVATIALVISKPLSTPQVETYTQFLDRLNCVNALYAALKTRVGG
jgi:hypothetical protein